MNIKKSEKNLLEFKEKGIYCSQGDFYIDPWLPVDRALITHAHGDHARPGSKYYLAQKISEPVLRLRLGQDINLQTVEYGEEIIINSIKITFIPAGHIPGSAQIRLEYQGKIWVVSGDYKIEYDNISTEFEPVKCHAFITESTFGLPIFKWQPQQTVFNEINEWWSNNARLGICSVIGAYSLGKAQRLIANVNPEIGPIYVHGAVYYVNKGIEEAGVKLPKYEKAHLSLPKSTYSNSLVIAPPSALNSPWIRKFFPHSRGIASGWMNVRGNKRRKAADKGFVLSDHADWDGLNYAIKETGAEKVYVTHGYKSAFARWLNEQGIESYEVDTLFEGEESENLDVKNDDLA